MRLGTIDPIVVGIARCTNTVIAAETSVKGSDTSSAASDSVATVERTPQTQATLSRNIVPDYTLYSLAFDSCEQTPVCGIAEVKNRKHFNDKSVCQTIGYQIASRAGFRSSDRDDADSWHPPLAILFCENMLRFIFFPFCQDGVACVDAIVTPPIPLYRYEDDTDDNDDTLPIKQIDVHWFAFICYYINILWPSITPLNPHSYGIIAHKKKEYTRQMEPVPTVEALQTKIERLEKEKQVYVHLYT